MPPKKTEVQSIGVVAEILTALSQSAEPRTAAQLARSLNMTQPRIWRYLNSLKEVDFIQSSAHGFSINYHLAGLAQKAMRNQSISQAANHEIVRLRDEFGESTYVAVPNAEDSLTVIMSMPSLSPISINIALGTRFALEGSAAGRVYIAHSNAVRVKSTQLKHTMPGHDPLDTPLELRERIELVKTRGFDTAKSENASFAMGSLYLSGAAAPIFDQSETVVGSVGFVTGRNEDELTDGSDIIESLKNTARRISATLGSTSY